MPALSSTFQPGDRSDPRAVLAGALAWWEEAGVADPLTLAPRAWLDRPVVVRAARSRSHAIESSHPAQPRTGSGAVEARPSERGGTQPLPLPAEGKRSGQASTSSGWTGDGEAVSDGTGAVGAGRPLALADLPTDLTTFRQWLATTPLPGLPDGGDRIVAEGPTSAAVAVVVARPAARHAVLDAPRRRLLTAMLKAIDLDIGDVALIPVVPSASGPAPQGELADAYRPLLLHHLSLTGAKRTLLLGDGPCRTALGGSSASLRGRWHDVNHGAGEVRVMASLDLDLLLAQPVCKRQAWADLLAFAGSAS